MNGIHDMGGMHGFGPIDREEHERRPWEWDVVVLNRAGWRLYDLDAFRFAIERMAPLDYLETPYFGRWLVALETNLAENGVRLVFGGGCVANLTSSRVSMTKMRRLRVFQRDRYVSMDFQTRQGMISRRLQHTGERPTIEVEHFRGTEEEPLKLEVESFLQAIATGTQPVVGGGGGGRHRTGAPSRAARTSSTVSHGPGEVTFETCGANAGEETTTSAVGPSATTSPPAMTTTFFHHAIL